MPFDSRSDIKLLRFISGIVPNSLISMVVYYQQKKKKLDSYSRGD